MFGGVLSCTDGKHNVKQPLKFGGKKKFEVGQLKVYLRNFTDPQLDQKLL